MSPQARVYVCLVLCLGVGSSLAGLARWDSENLLRFVCYLVVAALVSAMKVRLPGITGTLSVSFLIIFLAIAELHFAETLLIACTAAVVQSIYRTEERPQFLQVFFNAASICVSVASSTAAYHALTPADDKPWGLVIAAAVFFIVNTSSIAVVIALTEDKSAITVWKQSYAWSLPYYLLGAVVATMISATNRYFGWRTSLVALPVIIVVYRSYHLYIERLESEKKLAQEEKRHVEEAAAVQALTLKAQAAEQLGEANRQLQESLAERDALNNKLRGVLSNLDRTVEERTEQLQIVNDELRQENAVRQRAEEALRVSEQNYRLLFHGNPHPMWVLDSERLRFLAVNQAASELYGYPAEEFLSMTVADLRPEEDILRLLEAVTNAPMELRFDGSWRHKKKDGSIIFVEIRSHPVAFQGQSATLVLASDVTERRMLETQLQQAQKMEGIGRLAGGIAHDFNNLLTIINGYASRLAKAGPTTSGRIDGERILRAGERAAVLTHRLLAFSRKQLRQPRILNLNEIIDEMQDMLQRIIGDDIELITALSQETMTINADAVQLDQVLMNLVANARDAMPKGGKITVETGRAYFDAEFCRRHAGARVGHYCVMAVTDTGTGMDKHTQEHLFEPFFTTKDRDKGTGLGMSVVYGIVQQSEGYISVYSELGIGTTMKVYLPAVNGRVEVRTELPIQLASQRGCGTILLVEDNDGLREFAAEVLQMCGYRVLCAGEGAEALAVAEKHQGEIQLVISDVIMPGINGRELAKRIIACRPSIKILYMSGYAENAITQDGILEAGLALLPKPFSAESLASKVHEVLHAQRDVDTGRVLS